MGDTMSSDYSENIFVQHSAANLLRDELGWKVACAYNMEMLGENGTFDWKSYQEIVLWRYLQQAVIKLNLLLKEVCGRMLPKLMNGEIEV